MGAEKKKSRVEQQDAAKMLTFLEDYECVIYGGAAPDGEMCLHAESTQKNLMDLLRVTKGKWYWIYYLSFLLKRA